MYQQLNTSNDHSQAELYKEMLQQLSKPRLQLIGDEGNDGAVRGIIGQIDPMSLNVLTYSSIVQVLSEYMVPSDNPFETPMIPLLEKFANLLQF